jgi:hypothetical protein
MTHMRGELIDVLGAAVATGNERAMRVAAKRLLDATRAASVDWAVNGSSRFMILPVTSAEWGAIMLAGRGAKEGPRLWSRHIAADYPIEDLTLGDFKDLVVCRLVAGDTTPLPPTPAADELDRELVSEVGSLRRLLESIGLGNAASVEYTLNTFQRMGRRPIFMAGLRAVARSKGVRLKS